MNFILIKSSSPDNEYCIQLSAQLFLLSAPLSNETAPRAYKFAQLNSITATFIRKISHILIPLL